MFEKLIFVLWFFFPAGIANSVPVLAAKIPIIKNFSFPVDFYQSFKGKRILGDHKTYRGFITGIIFCIIVAYLQQFIYSKNSYLQQISPINYNKLNPLILGFLFGFGSLLGDSIRSFFKRRQNIKPGGTWFPFDQIDYIIGGIIFTLPYIQLTFQYYLLLFVVYFIMHPLTTITGYYLGLKEKPI